MQSKDHLVWLDLEMTGLDPGIHGILELGCVITDSQLQIVAEMPCLVIAQPAEVLARMDPWCVQQHGRSGLLDRAQKSGISLAEAEQRTLAFLRQYCFEKTSPLCGNSIGQDRRFLHQYMPALNDFFHYRNIDVSSIKELVNRWYPPAMQAPAKSKTHHVMDDIRESIEELKHYRRVVFK